MGPITSTAQLNALLSGSTTQPSAYLSGSATQRWASPSVTQLNAHLSSGSATQPWVSSSTTQLNTHLSGSATQPWAPPSATQRNAHFSGFATQPRASLSATQLKTPLISSATRLNTPLSGSTTRPRASPSSTKLKVKRRKGVQKKVSRKNPSSEAGKSQKSKRSTVDPRSPAFRRATQILSEVSNHHPSFAKGMLRSIVVVGYWLGIPKSFCDQHMPEEDSMFILEDEGGKEYSVKYLGEKKGLSGGWQLFAKEHHLIVGDVLVFRLIRPFRFKVHIVPCKRPNVDDEEVDAARSLLRLDGSSSRQHDSADAAHQENHPSSNAFVIHDDDDDGTATPSERRMEDTTLDGSWEENVVGCECMNHTSPCEGQQVISFEDFRIVVDDLVLDSFMPQALRMKYYDLCVSQQMLLHEHVLRGQNCQLVVGMIHELVDIAEAIKGSNVGSVADNFTLWHKKLRGLRIWGMSVDFLIDRLEQLMVVALKSEEYEAVRGARERAEEGRKRLQLKVGAVEARIGRLDGRLRSLDPHRLEADFRALSSAPW